MFKLGMWNLGSKVLEQLEAIVTHNARPEETTMV